MFEDDRIPEYKPKEQRNTGTCDCTANNIGKWTALADVPVDRQTHDNAIHASSPRSRCSKTQQHAHFILPPGRRLSYRLHPCGAHTHRVQQQATKTRHLDLHAEPPL
eukprot:TRINITY_DN40005_c0_g1_i1.p3 TRINITY_DN40005_c0_g1~~TRINITY_DN40005_c0_g1_i1.p3  ORF type:complete len:107 (+),score=1.28 TRINITY_DN40005_c0_g1_i1:356-676(+)